MSIAATRYYTWADIEPWVERSGLSDGELGLRVNPTYDVKAARRWVQRRKAEGFTYWEADAIALALGYMPGEVFDGWHDLPTVDVDAIFRALKWDARKRAEKRTATRKRQARARRVLVTGYERSERARAHRCDPEGCCGRVALEEIAA